MRKFVLLLCVCLLLAGCGAKGADGYAVEEMSLTDAMTAVLDGVANLPDYEIAELTEENFEFFTFIPYAQGSSAVEADALIGSTPHSVVLARVTDGAEQAEAAMRENADPRKWICVEAEKTVVRRYGDTILLVMSDTATANAILQNFDRLNGVETPEEDLAAPAYDPNTDYQPEALPDDVLNQPAATPSEGPAEMPTVTPDEGADDNMPTPDPGDDAVEMPTVKPEPEKPQTVPAPKPEAPATPAPAPAPQPEKPAENVVPTPEPAPEPAPEPKPEAPAQTGTDLSAVMAQILSGVELPDVGDVPLDADSFAFYAFIPYAEGYQGLASEAMMNAVAHSVVLVEVPEGGDAAKAAADMASGADPRKWICVEAESVQTASKGRLALLVMSTQAAADAIIANFNAI